MPLTSFGSILSFSEEIETQDMVFYEGALNHPESARIKPLLEEFIKEGKKNIIVIQRTKRENVTEMILEPIHGFARTPFSIPGQESSGMDGAKLVETVKILEQRSIDYYTSASVKIKALPEVAGALKQLAKKHTARLNKINEI